MRQFIAAAFLPLLFAAPGSAWNAAGHMLSAQIAYSHLSPAVRERVDAVLRKHPDYGKWVAGVPREQRGLEAFLQASVWPDTLRGDERFWDPRRNSSEPKPLLPGFPDMEAHSDWHYRDIPLSAPGAPAPVPPVPNIATQLAEFVSTLEDPYRLSWFLHLAGDAHQPLHSVSRFLKPGDTGDRGGNTVVVTWPTAKNLHEFWDEAALGTPDRAEIAGVAATLPVDASLAARSAHTDHESWLRESWETARDVVYSLEPPQITSEYEARARTVARERLALAGLRIAAILNSRLQP